MLDLFLALAICGCGMGAAVLIFMAFGHLREPRGDNLVRLLKTGPFLDSKLFDETGRKLLGRAGTLFLVGIAFFIVRLVVMFNS